MQMWTLLLNLTHFQHREGPGGHTPCLSDSEERMDALLFLTASNYFVRTFQV